MFEYYDRPPCEGSGRREGEERPFRVGSTSKRASATESNVSHASAAIRGRRSAGGARGVRRTRGWENAVGVELPGSSPGGHRARGEEGVGRGSGSGGGGGTPRTDVAVEVESCTATVTGCVSVCASFLRSLPHSFLLRILLSCSPWRNIWPTSSGQRRTGSTVPSISRLVRGLRPASSSRRRRRRRLNCIGVVPPVPHACASPDDNDRIVSTRRSLLPSS